MLFFFLELTLGIDRRGGYLCGVRGGKKSNVTFLLGYSFSQVTKKFPLISLIVIK